MKNLLQKIYIEFDSRWRVKPWILEEYGMKKGGYKEKIKNYNKNIKNENIINEDIMKNLTITYRNKSKINQSQNPKVNQINMKKFLKKLPPLFLMTAFIVGSLGIFPQKVHAGSQTYTVAGADTFNVPAGVTTITVKVWGAGGGGGGSGDSTSQDGGGGGGGGFSQGDISVTPEEQLDVAIGGGGALGTATGGSTDTGEGAGGGGFSGVSRGGTYLIQAGGGGGGGGGGSSTSDQGGGGGGGAGGSAGGTGADGVSGSGNTGGTGGAGGGGLGGTNGGGRGGGPEAAGLSGGGGGGGGAFRAGGGENS